MISMIAIRGPRNTNLMAPGSTVTSATDMVVEILKVLVSAIFADPPLYCVALTWEKEKVKGVDVCP